MFLAQAFIQISYSAGFTRSPIVAQPLKYLTQTQHKDHILFSFSVFDFLQLSPQ
jgi:hypothetical protein